MGLKSRLQHYGERIQLFATHVAEARKERAVPAQFADLVIHKIRINARWLDYYLYEFYKGNRSWEEKSRYVSKRGSRYYPYENNSIKYLYLFNNKLVTKTLLAGLNLPQPKLLATIGDDYEIKNREQLSSFLTRMNFDLVIKPLDDSGGHGVLVLTHDTGIWRMDSQPCGVEEVWKQISRTMRKGHLMEEKVRNTQQIAALYPHSLNTVRVVTIKTADGRWHTTATGTMRIGSGGRAVDNLGAGGIMVSIDSSGSTFQAYDFARSRPLTHHPDTGAPLVGITIDGYHEAIELGLRASEQFGFMGLIGWDIALTDRGPLIVEGNANPDCWYFQRGEAGGWITDEMARGLKTHRPFARWDKTRIHPEFKIYRPIKA